MAFGEAAREIRAGRIQTTEDVLQFRRVGALIPSDPAFRTAFAEWRVPRAALARYLLRALELAEKNEKEPELVVNSDESQVNLEHILPRSSRDADWPGFSADDRRALTYRLGNMCLLKKGPNGRIGNKAWSVKKPVIAASKLTLTSRLGIHDQWGEREIQDSQKYLADLAIKAWPRLPRS